MSDLKQTRIDRPNTFISGLNKDSTDIYLKEGFWTHAINVANKTFNGNIGSLTNEPSTVFCASSNFTIIESVYKTGSEWIIFSTDNTSSEIGLFDESNCSYTPIVNDPCLGFKKTHLITGACKANYDGTYSVYWQDSLNPDRVLNINRVPYKETGNNLSPDPDCWIPEYSEELDCDKLRLNPLIEQPCVTLVKGLSPGQIVNGTYMVFMAYSSNNIRVTDYFLPTNPISLWDHSGSGGSLEVNLSNLDSNFEEYEIVIVSIINSNLIARKVGHYSSRQSIVSITNVSETLPIVDWKILPLKNPVYDKSDKMFQVNNYLVRSGVSTKKQVNYQKLANQITTEWVAVKYPSNYYFHAGRNLSYMRDEVYPFFIRWVYTNGHRTASYLILGRGALPGEKDPITGPDVLPNETEVWQVCDTSTWYPSSGTLPDKGQIISRGKMAYHESTELLPDDQPDVWFDECGKNIRHHKMPSDETIGISQDNGDSIVVLGVEFNNIKHPLDENNNPIEDIVGFEILRGSREGNKSIIAKGMLNNMHKYNMEGNTYAHQNYPYNETSADTILTTNSSWMDTENTPSFSNLNLEAEHNFLSFHSPDTVFTKPFLANSYLKVYLNYAGEPNGQHRVPHKHPKHKIITDLAFVTASFIAAGIAVLAAFGKTKTETDITAPTQALSPLAVKSSMESPTGPISTILATTQNIILNPTSAAISAASLVDMVAYSSYFLAKGLEEALAIFYKVVSYKDYVLQYDSHCFYKYYKNIISDEFSGYGSYKHCYRRPINDIKYIGNGVQDFNQSITVNNYRRNPYVCLDLDIQGYGIKYPHDFYIGNTSQSDNSRTQVVLGNRSGLPSFEKPFVPFKTWSTAYYGALKISYPNQYGKIESIKQIPINSCLIKTTASTSINHSSGIIFGGDVYINRYTEKNPFYFYNSWLFDAPDGQEFNYRNYVNGPIPRYWADFSYFDISDFNITFNGIIPNITTPSDFHNLDRDGSGLRLSVKNAWMYLFFNGVRDFFVESEINTAYRDYEEDDTKKFYDPYGGSFNDVKKMFRSDLITEPIYNKYDFSLSIPRVLNNFGDWGVVLPPDYDPALYNKYFHYYPKRAVYSLQHREGLKRDHWRNYLALNYKDFQSRVTSMKQINNGGSFIFFDEANPVMFSGQDQLQTEGGIKVTIGDGGLFAGSFTSITSSDEAVDYGCSDSSRSIVNTPYGVFWISNKNGKIFQYTNTAEDISRNGLNSWFNENLKSKLLLQYPNCELKDNPVAGVAFQTVYDPQLELVYFTKKDYVPLRYDIYFNDPSGVPYTIESVEIREGEFVEAKKFCPFTNTNFFKPCNWTLSYDPVQKYWVSYHDWVPDLLLQSPTHFISIKDNKFWKHNTSKSSYGVYYDTPYGSQIELPIISPVSTLSHVNVIAEFYKYFNSGKDYNHILDSFFNYAIIYNSEQISGLLKLNINPKNNPLTALQYPKVQSGYIDTLYSKEENKYSFNQFWDITKDRKEFCSTNDIVPMWNTECNGYQRYINPDYVNYNVPTLERKKFRHYANRIILMKNAYMENLLIDGFNGTFEGGNLDGCYAGFTAPNNFNGLIVDSTLSFSGSYSAKAVAKIVNSGSRSFLNTSRPIKFRKCKTYILEAYIYLPEDNEVLTGNCISGSCSPGIAMRLLNGVKNTDYTESNLITWGYSGGPRDNWFKITSEIYCINDFESTLSIRSGSLDELREDGIMYIDNIKCSLANDENYNYIIKNVNTNLIQSPR